MKLLRLVLFICMLPMMAHAQDVDVKEGNMKMGKKKMWTFSASYPYDKVTTAAVMQQNMEKAGLKHYKKKKGVTKYMGVSWPAVSNSKGDYYYKIKSKKGRTMVYMAASKGYDNYVTTANDAIMAGKVTTYLQSLDGQIANAIAIQQKEAEMRQIAQRNEQLNKELEANKAKEVQNAKDLKTMRTRQVAPLEVK